MMKQLQSVFCDDIRQEVSGKLTYVGVYTGSLLVSAFPAVLPQFFVAVSLVTDAVPREGSIQFRILKDDSVLAERALDSGQIGTAASEVDAEAPSTSSERVHVLNTFFAFAPLEIDAPCTLRIRGLIDGEELKALGLKVDLIPTM